MSFEFNPFDKKKYNSRNPIVPYVKSQKYKCMKHLTNDGFYNEKGLWTCWVCYKENPYYNPRGRIVDEFVYGDFTIRLVDRTSSMLGLQDVDVFHKEKRVSYHSNRDLSVTLRTFEDQKRKILSGKKFVSNYSDTMMRDLGNLAEDSIREPINSDAWYDFFPSLVRNNNWIIYSNIDGLIEIDERWGLRDWDDWLSSGTFSNGNIIDFAFINCVFNGTNLQFCDIVDSVFEDCVISSSTLVRPILRNCRLSNCIIYDERENNHNEFDENCSIITTISPEGEVAEIASETNITSPPQEEITSLIEEAREEARRRIRVRRNRVFG